MMNTPKSCNWKTYATRTLAAGAVFLTLNFASCSSSPQEKSQNLGKDIMKNQSEIERLKVQYNATLVAYTDFMQNKDRYPRVCDIYIKALNEYNAVANENTAKSAQKLENLERAKENLEAANKTKVDYEEELEKLEKRITKKSEKVATLIIEKTTLDNDTTNHIIPTTGNQQAIPDGLIQVPLPFEPYE